MKNAHPQPQLDYWFDQTRLAALDVVHLSSMLTQRPQLTYPTRHSATETYWLGQMELAR